MYPYTPHQVSSYPVWYTMVFGRYPHPTDAAYAISYCTIFTLSCSDVGGRRPHLDGFVVWSGGDRLLITFLDFISSQPKRNRNYRDYSN